MTYRPGYTSRPAASFNATHWVAAAIGFGFLVSFFSSGKAAQYLLFDAGEPFRYPWSFLTYPYAFPPGAFLSALFGILWLIGIGGSVERELGRNRFFGFWFVMTLLGSLMTWVGSMVMNRPDGLMTAWMPIAAVTVAWGTRNPNAQVNFMLILPITGRWMAWLAAALAFFGTSPYLAPFAASPLLLAHLFAANKLAFAPWSGASRIDGWEKKRDKRLLDLIDDSIDRKKEREERERLRKLFEGSISDEDERKEG